MKLRYDWPHFEAFWSDFKGKLQSYMVPECERVMKYIRLGWSPEDKAFEMFRVLSANVRASIPKTVMQRTVGGGILRVPSLLAGDPKHFTRNTPIADVAENKKGKTHIKLCTNVDAIAGVGPELFKLRGAAMVALAEALEAAGKRVELSVAIATRPYVSGYYSSSNNHDENQRYFVTVKPFSSPVSPLLHSYPLMNPDVLRTLFFSFWKTLPYEEDKRFYKGTAGMVGVVPDHGADLYIAEFGDYNAGNYTDLEGAKAWILAQMKAFGVDVDAGKK
jgi:hypothetical protein